MEGLKLLATTRKNANVLMHIAGYFKKSLTAGEKRELLDLIDHYRRGHLPLIVPLVLINHHINRFDQPYMKDQVYLHPHPLTLLLRDHARTRTAK